MVIETFKAGCMPKVYARYAERGRMLPEGLVYIDSWLTADQRQCFQLMETADASLFEPWIAQWSDLVNFEVIAVEASPTKRDQ
ncbi:MAG: DUF3303 domain-containing protein [Bradymonadia bacterium]